MDQLDLLYRAFLDYRKNTEEDGACRKLRMTASRTSADKDKVETQRSKCTIEEDWVIAIEEGLPFVEKAIMEERQFIRQEGGIVPIEKVRHVSKSSVEHLARHGNLITRIPKADEDLIPDKLYIVENLSNYAVYENRFLYMLLCYLRDFIDLRYHKIVELGNTYKADMSMTKKFQVGKRTISYDTHFFEEAKNDPYSKMDKATGEMIDRIMVLQKNIQILLNTPLMKEVSTAPMLKPPITRTNALRMDNALRQALALYDYVASYQKDGYSVEIVKKTFNPFPDVMSDEFSEMIVMSSFLVYEYGNDLKGQLKEAYDAEEERRAQEANRRMRRRLDELKNRAKREGQTLEEYVLLLEERNCSLEPLAKKLEEAEEKIRSLESTVDELNDRAKRLTQTNADLNSQIDYLQEEIVCLNEQHKIEWSAHKEAYEKRIAEMIRRHAEEIRCLREDYEQRLTEMRDLYEEKIAEMEREHALEIERLNTEHAAEIERLNAEHAEELRVQQEKYEEECRRLTDAYEARLSEKDAEMAQLKELHQAAIDKKDAEMTSLKERHQADLAAKDHEMSLLEEQHQIKLSEIKEDHRKAIETYDASVSERDEKYRETVSEYEQKLSEKQELLNGSQNECQSLKKKNHDLKSQLHGIRQQHGLKGDEEDYTSEERFEELLEEIRALDDLLGAEWKKAKKKIRNQYLWKKSTS